MFRKLIPAILLIAAIAPAAQAHQPDPHTSEPSVSIAEVRDALGKRRAKQLERLRAYRDAKSFPRNRVSDDVINVFRDEDGLLCAVANLIFLDGQLDLVAKTARDDNYVKMGDLKSGALHEWILSSGFTQEEIAAIQLPDSPVVHGQIDWFTIENARIIAHLDEVEKMLIDNTETALDLAAARFQLASTTNFDALRGLVALAK